MTQSVLAASVHVVHDEPRSLKPALQLKLNVSDGTLAPFSFDWKRWICPAVVLELTIIQPNALPLSIQFCTSQVRLVPAHAADDHVTVEPMPSVLVVCAALDVPKPVPPGVVHAV